MKRHKPIELIAGRRGGEKVSPLNPIFQFYLKCLANFLLNFYLLGLRARLETHKTTLRWSLFAEWRIIFWTSLPTEPSICVHHEDDEKLSLHTKMWAECGRIICSSRGERKFYLRRKKKKRRKEGKSISNLPSPVTAGSCRMLWSLLPFDSALFPSGIISRIFSSGLMSHFVAPKWDDRARDKGKWQRFPLHFQFISTQRDCHW